MSGRKLRNELDREDLDRLPVHPGLCATCVHLRLLRSKRSVFLRCGKAETDERFLRYPPLPVGRCGGWEKITGEVGENPGPGGASPEGT